MWKMEKVNSEDDIGSPQQDDTQPEDKTEQPNHHTRSIINRPGFGSGGRHIPLLVNHFKVSIKNPDEIFYHYSVWYYGIKSLSIFFYSLKKSNI